MAAGCLSFAAVGITLVAQILPAQATSASNLVSYWKFDESTAGSTAVDSSGNGNDLTPVNSPTPTTDIPGVMNAAIPDSYSASFNGSTQYFTVADNSSLDSTSAVSVSTWVKFNNTSGNQTILAKWQVGVHQQWVLQLNSGHISWWTGDGYSGANELASSTAITAGTWYHLVATATSGSKQLYINGTLDASNTAGAMGVAAGTPLTIGSKPSSSGTFFEYLNGEVDDARVYSRVLSGTEASSLATGSEANTLVGGSAITNELGTSSAITDLQVISTATNPTVYVKMYVGQGTISLTTTTGLTFYGADGSSLGSSQPANSASLHIGGSLSSVNADLATLHYTRTTSGTGSDTLSASLVGPGEAFFSGNGHSYQYVAGPVTWSQAQTAAAASSKYGAQGYLATITSQAENDFIATQLKSDSWIGASDAAVEGTWDWVTGPESGEQFWQGNGQNAGSNTVNGMYAHWNNPVTGGTGQEPNDSGGNEDCAEFYYSNNGLWNDLNCSNTLGYIIEYGGLNGINPTVSTAAVAITTADTTAPTAPGKPSVSPASPTTHTTPSLSWTAATDSGTGLASPAYTVQWSTTADFSTITGSATTNSTAYTVGTPIADGTYYFRVLAADKSGNITPSALTSAYIIDTTPPTAPGQPTTASPTNNTAPLWTWTASVDDGSGIIPFGYTFEWSSSPDFASIAGAISVSPTYAQVSMPEGTWYTRVLGEDKVDNSSVWSPVGMVVVDTTAPDAPLASLPGGTYDSAQTTGLSATDNSDIAAIYYTTDGSTPGSSSTVYSSPITIARSLTLKAIAYDQAGNASPVMSETYTITLPPQTSGGSSPAQSDNTAAKQSSGAASSPTTSAPAATSSSSATDPMPNTSTEPHDTILLDNATKDNTAKPGANGRDTSAFLGLGWWWLPLLAIIAYLWFLLFGRRRKQDREQR
jgi:hypothetical protein